MWFLEQTKQKDQTAPNKNLYFHYLDEAKKLKDADQLTTPASKASTYCRAFVPSTPVR